MSYTIYIIINHIIVVFQKGNTLQSRKHSEETKRKLSERRKAWYAAGNVTWNKGRKFPELTGANSPVWQKKPGYFPIHSWLLREFGKAVQCEASWCKGISQSYEWALLKGKKYERKRENFWALCKSCHRKYDMSEQEKRFARRRKRSSSGTFL